MNHIEAQSLTTFEVTDDGARLHLNAEDAKGSAVSLSLPIECLSQMVMTLPRMAQAALRRQHRDDSLRIVYPASMWAIERGQGKAETFILTLSTLDGFEVSFALDSAALAGLKRSMSDAASAPKPLAAGLN